MAERVTGGRPQHGRVGKSSATRDELEEAESTHHTRSGKPRRSAASAEARGCMNHGGAASTLAEMIGRLVGWLGLG